MVKFIQLVLLVLLPLLLKASQPNLLSFLLVADNYHFDLFVVGFERPDEIQEMEKQLVEKFIGQMSKIAMGFVSSGNLADVSSAMLSLKETTLNEFKTVYDKLPETIPINYSLYLVPTTAEESVVGEAGGSLDQFVDEQFEIATDLGTLKVNLINFSFSLDTVVDENGDLDFSTVSDEDFWKYAETFSRLYGNTEKNKQRMFEKNGKWAKDPTFLAGISLQASLLRNDSALQVQALVALKDMKVEQENPTQEVVIREVSIPKGVVTDGRSSHPMVLISTEFRENDERPLPIVTLKFGSFGSLEGQGDYLGSFTLQGEVADWDPWLPDDECLNRIASTPRFTGQWTDQVHDFGFGEDIANWLFKNENVEFSLFSVELELQKDGTLKNNQTDIRFNTFGLTCLKVKRVDDNFGQQLEDEIGEAISDLISVDDLTDNLMSHIDTLWN